MAKCESQVLEGKTAADKALKQVQEQLEKSKERAKGYKEKAKSYKE